MSNQQAKPTIERPTSIPLLTWLLLAGTLFGKLVYKSAIPFLSLFLLRHDHLTASLIGFILGASYLVGAFMSLVSGYLIDLLGQKRLMLLSLVTLAGSIAMIPFVHQTLLIGGVVLAVGAFRNSFETSNQSLLVQVTPVSRRSEVFSIRYIVVNLAAGAGPLLGAWLGYSGQTASFLINGGDYLLYACLLYVLTRSLPNQMANDTTMEPSSMRAAYRDIAGNRPFLFGLLAACMLNYGYTQIDVTLPQVLAVHGSLAAHWFAWMLGLNTLLIATLQWPVTRWIRRYPKRWTMSSGAVLSAIGYWTFGNAHDLLSYLMGMVIVTFGEMLSLTLIVPWLVELSNPALQGAYFGAARLRFLGDFAGALLGGAILEHLGVRSLFESTCILVFTAVLWLAFSKTRSHRPAPSSESGNWSEPDAL